MGCWWSLEPALSESAEIKLKFQLVQVEEITVVQDPNRHGLHTYGYDNNHSYPYSSGRVCLKYNVLPTIDHRSHIPQCVPQIFYLSYGVYKKEY